MTHNAIFAVLSTNWLTVLRWVLVPCLLIPVASFSQDHTREIDSLRMLLNSLPKDAFNERGRVYVELGLITDTEVTIKYCDSAIAILKDSTQIVRAVHNKATMLRHLARHHEARTALESVLTYAQKFQPYTEATELNWYLEGVYGMLSAIYAFDGEYRMAIHAANHALELGVLFPEKADLSRTYNHLGIIFYKLRDNERAIAMYNKAIDLQPENFGKDSVRASVHAKNRLKMLSNIGLCYSEMDSLSKALIYFDSIRKSTPQLDASVFMNFGYGMVFLKQGKYRQAEGTFQTALTHAGKSSNIRMMAECLIYSARVYLKTARYTDAQKAIYEAEKLASENNFNEILLDTYRQALVLFSEAGDHARLADYQSKYIRHKQHIHNADVASELVLAELRLAEATHNEELAVQERKLSAQQTLLKYQQWLSRASVGVAVLIFLFILSLIYRVTSRLRIERTLSALVDERMHNLVMSERRAKQLSMMLSQRNEAISFEVETLVGEARSGFSERIV